MRSRESVEVIEFEGASLRASVPTMIRERAAAAIALIDCPLDGIGDMARGALTGVALRPFPRFPACGEALLRDAFDEEVERSLYDRRAVVLSSWPVRR